MDTFKKKIVLAGIVTFFAFLVTIGSTYAWFTTGQTSAIGQISMEIQTDTSLLILLDKNYDYGVPANKTMLDNPASYFSSLSNDQITTYYNFNNIDLEPVTTYNGTDYLRNDRITAASSEASSSGQYLLFSVWMLSQDNNVEVSLKDLSVTADNGSILANAVAQAVRVSTKYSTDAAQIYGLDKDYGFQFMPGMTGYDSEVSTNNEITSGNQTALETLYHKSFYSSGTVVPGESATLPNADVVFQLPSNTPRKITLRIWVEGWDSDCTNNVLSTDFTIAFDFTVKGTYIP